MVGLRKSETWTEAAVLSWDFIDSFSGQIKFRGEWFHTRTCLLETGLFFVTGFSTLSDELCTNELSIFSQFLSLKLAYVLKNPVLGMFFFVFGTSRDVS